MLFRDPPVFGTIGTIYFYKGVDIYVDIPITNISALVISTAFLLGLKSEAGDDKVSVKGQLPSGQTLTFSSGNIKIVLPAEGSGSDLVKNYPYVLRTGSPPAFTTFTAAARFKSFILTFAKPTDALAMAAKVWKSAEPEPSDDDEGIWQELGHFACYYLWA